MPDQVTKLRVFVSSPGDVQKERQALGKVVDELNRTVAAPKQLVLELIGWETHVHPDFGVDPQEVINRQIGPADIFVGIMWRRLGTPTKRAASGTVEEFEQAYQLWKDQKVRDILFYFKTAPFQPKDIKENEEFRSVLEFRERLKALGLLGDFKTIRDFESKARAHLTQVLNNWQEAAPAGTKVIVAQAAELHRPGSVVEIEENLLPKTSLATGQYSVLSLGWLGLDQIAFATRGTGVFIADATGKLRKITEGGAVPDYLSARGGMLTLMSYTRVFVIDVQTGSKQSIEYESRASGYVAEWSPSGKYLAVCGTNYVKLYGADLSELARHHVTGKYGSSALAWIGNQDTLCLGLGNGELWELTPPFEKPRQVAKRDAKVLALRARADDGRFACYWYDGRVEVRRGAEVLASAATEPQSKWTGGGPKLAWCLDNSVIAVTSGLGSEVLFWHLASGKVAACHMGRQIEALDASPDGTLLAVGTAESPRPNLVDAELWRIDLSGLPGLFAKATAPSTETRPHHLLKADWTPLVDAIEDGDSDEDMLKKLRLDIPPLNAELDSNEKTIRGFDAEPGIIRELEKGLRKQRKRAEGILADILWLARQMRQAGYQEHDIILCCDRAVSYLSSRILTDLEVRSHPGAGDEEEFVASVLGCAKDEVLSLGFDAADGRGLTVPVPLQFLSSVEELVRMGESALREQGVQKASARQKVVTACRQFHVFDLLFGWNDRRELWSTYVLPYALATQEHEQIVIKHSEIERFWLL